MEADKRAFSGEIKGGKYDLKAEPGKMTVEITASRHRQQRRLDAALLLRQ
jgi:hypothetical protein